MTDTDQGNLSTDESITSGDQQNENLRAETSISTSSNAIRNPSLLQSNEIRTQASYLASVSNKPAIIQAGTSRPSRSAFSRSQILQNTVPERRSSSRSIKRKKFDDELVESSLFKTERTTRMKVPPPPFTERIEPIVKIIKETPVVTSKSSSAVRRAKRQKPTTPASTKDLGRWKPQDDLALITAVQQKAVENPTPMASVCTTHNSMLSYLETAINDIHINLINIDTEVSQNLFQGHSPQSALWTCWTPQFFKEPSKESCNPTISLEGSRDETNCSNCVVELPRILFTVKKEVDRHVQYVDFIQEKMNAVSMSTAKANLTPKSHAFLNRNASVRRSKIRTNPSFPVLHSPIKLASEESHGALLTNQNSSVQDAEFFKHLLTLESQPCVCCEKCSSVLHLFSKTVCSRVKHLKDQCHELKMRLVKELQEKEREINLLLSQIKNAKENVSSSFCQLENLGQQCLAIFTNFQDKKDKNSKQCDNCKGNQFDIRSAADDQSCDKESTNQNSGLLYDSNESTNKNTRLPSSSSEGSYTLPVGLSHEENHESNVDNSEITESGSHDNSHIDADDEDRICIYDELVFPTQNEQQEAESKQPFDFSVSCDIDKSPLPELIEFQRKRFDSLNRYDKLFRREDFRRRSQSNPVSFQTRKTMNASGPYNTIQEGTDDSLTQDGPSTELHHAKSECVIDQQDIKQRKIKKSKSSMMVQATKIKNFITKKFKRKSLGGKSQRKSASSSSVQASSTGVQFFEYDFSDDGIDKSLNATSDRLGDLSFLTGMSNNLDNSMFDMDFRGHKLDFSGPNLDFSRNDNCDSLQSSAMHSISEDETETFSESNTNYSYWFNKQITSIERLLNDTTGGEDMPVHQLTEDLTPHLKSVDPRNSRSQISQRNGHSHTKKHQIQMVLPPKLRTQTNLYYNDFAIERSPSESLSAISCIEPVDHLTDITDDTMDNSLFEEAGTRVFGLSFNNSQAKIQTSHSSESLKHQVFDAERKVSSSSDNSVSFNDNRGFDVNHGYGTSNIFSNKKDGRSFLS
ncbi:MCRS1 [Mytilus coruscus]|uniref:MCRS1 n=1 Tax=Mytilus coruscus TaxID=42192 RepID=A0A6J8C0Q3_MYTCO|nr:MCRS1 [Mytilus coruscus]